MGQVGYHSSGFELSVWIWPNGSSAENREAGYHIVLQFRGAGMHALSCWCAAAVQLSR